MAVATEDIVIECLQSFVDSGEHENVTVDGATNPIAGLGCVSEDGIDFAIDLSDRLGWRLPDEFNPFVNDAGTRARTVAEIAEKIDEIAATQRKQP